MCPRFVGPPTAVGRWGERPEAADSSETFHPVHGSGMNVSLGATAGPDEIGLVFQEQVGDMVEVNEAIEGGRAQAVFTAEFVA